MTKHDIEQVMKRRIALAGYTLDENGNQLPFDAANREFLTALASASANPKEQAELILAAQTDPEKRKMLASLRVEQTNNFVFAESTIGASFFEVQTLGPSDEPAYTNYSKNEVRMGYMGEDGSPDTVRVVKAESNGKPALRLLTTPWVQYKTMDLYKGDVSAIAKSQFDINRDLTFNFDRELFKLLTASIASGGAFGPFGYETANGDPLTGTKNKATRVYLPHSGIKTVHLPTTNDLDLTGTAKATATVSGVANVVKNPGSVATTAFGVPVLRAILQYANSWANVLPEGGRLVPSGEVIVPASDIIAIAEALAPTANASAQDLQEQVNANGYMGLSYLGTNWRFIPDITIDKGTCYPRFNQLPGIVWRKPVYDKEYVEANLPEHWEKRCQQMAYGAAILSQRRARALRIKYA